MPAGSVFATGADASYGYQLLNLIGSLRVNSDVFDRVVAFDLGLDARQRGWLEAAEGIELRRVPAFVPHWNRGFTWKPWAWMHVEGDAVLWVDAGATVLRSLAPVVASIREQGCFLVSQGNAVRDILPTSFFEEYGLSPSYGDRPYAAAGIVGFRPGGAFFERVLVPTYEDCLAGRNLGFSAGEIAGKNVGLGRGPVGVTHDCPHFRWDQSVFNARLLQAMPDAPLADLDEHAGWQSPHDHPRQLIWHHRRRGSLRYVKRLRTRGPGRIVRASTGLYLQLRWWTKLNGHLFERTTYVLKAKRVLRPLLGRLRR